MNVSCCRHSRSLFSVSTRGGNTRTHWQPAPVWQQHEPFYVLLELKDQFPFKNYYGSKQSRELLFLGSSSKLCTTKIKYSELKKGYCNPLVSSLREKKKIRL